jgi:6-phosphogluconolactonase (cycloisomerase 2 family)
LLVAACGLHCDTPGPAVLPQARFAYVANILDSTISVYAQDVASGQWRHRGYVTSAGPQPYSVATHPTGQFVYVTSDGSATIAAYAIDKTTGMLTLVNSASTAANPQSIAISPSGNFLYVANRTIGGVASVSSFAVVTTTGALSPIDIDATGGEPHSVTLDPAGKFAYTANFATHDVSIFSVNSTNGTLTPAGTASVGAGTNPNYLVVHLSGKYAYTANWGSGTVSVFSVSATTGALSAVGAAVNTGGANPAVLALDPSGKFLFVTNFGSSNVSVFRIDPSTGALASVAGSPFATGANPHFVEVDPAGTFVYVGNFSGHSVTSYALDGATGILTPLAHTPEVTTRYFPVTFAINRAAAPLTLTPKSAYVANSGGDDITAYSIDATSGVLSKINCVAGGGVVCSGTDPANFATGTALPSIRLSVTVDGLSRFVYVTNIESRDVTAYSIGANGELTKVNCVAGGGVVCGATDPTGFATGASPLSVTVDASGRFAYVANVASNDITAYRIGVTGALTKINCVVGGGVVCGTTDPTNFAAGDGPQAVALDATGRFAFVPNSASNDVSAYFIDVTTGGLIKIDCVAGGGVVCGTTDPTNFAAGDSPISFSIDPTGRFAYLTHGGTGNDITAYRIGVTGALTKINCVAGGGVVCGTTDPTNFAAGGYPAAVSISPSGSFAYVPNYYGDDVTAFSINSDGMLIWTSCVPGNGLVCNGNNMVAGTKPAAVAQDPTGNFTYVANEDSANVAAYRISASGLLAETRYFAAGSKPTSIAITGGFR